MLIYEFRNVASPLSINNRNPADYLRFLFKIATISFNVIYIALIWTQAEAILTVFNSMECLQPALNALELTEQDTDKAMHKCKEWAIWVVCSSYFLAAVIQIRNSQG
jgi:hypothetical protein